MKAPVIETVGKDSRSWEQYHLDLARKDEALLWPDDSVIRFYKKDLKKIGARKVLEIGCGAGRHVYFFRLMGLNVVGTDLAHSAIDFTRNRLEKDGLIEGVELRPADATEIPYPDNSFDGILAWRFLHVLSPVQAQKCISEILRLLRPGGKVLLGTRSPRSTNYELICSGKDVDADFDYRSGQLSERAVKDTYFSRRELEDLFSDFQKIEVEHIEWTRNNGTFRTAYWAVTATKPLSV
jgi:ubiquinone/menaquinone biosynthesis C-methylase UbiE